ncbi:MAG: hypothetical protein ACOCQD_04820 [archaeon]
MKIVKYDNNLAIKIEDEKYLELFTTDSMKKNGIDKTIEYLTDPTKTMPAKIDIDDTGMGEEDFNRAENLKKFLDEYLEYRTHKINGVNE